MEEKRYTLDDFVEVMKALRGENGCPWDRVQTHESLRMDMLEEAYEAIDGINEYEATVDYKNLREELGDIVHSFRTGLAFEI